MPRIGKPERERFLLGERLRELGSPPPKEPVRKGATDGEDDGFNQQQVLGLLVVMGVVVVTTMTMIILIFSPILDAVSKVSHAISLPLCRHSCAYRRSCAYESEVRQR